MLNINCMHMKSKVNSHVKFHSWIDVDFTPKNKLGISNCEFKNCRATTGGLPLQKAFVGAICYCFATALRTEGALCGGQGPPLIYNNLSPAFGRIINSLHNLRGLYGIVNIGLVTLAGQNTVDK